jgi:hypothetical protein
MKLSTTILLLSVSAAFVSTAPLAASLPSLQSEKTIDPASIEPSVSEPPSDENFLESEVQQISTAEETESTESSVSESYPEENSQERNPCDEKKTEKKKERCIKRSVRKANKAARKALLKAARKAARKAVKAARKAAKLAAEAISTDTDPSYIACENRTGEDKQACQLALENFCIDARLTPKCSTKELSATSVLAFEEQVLLDSGRMAGRIGTRSSRLYPWDVVPVADKIRYDQNR